MFSAYLDWIRDRNSDYELYCYVAIFLGFVALIVGIVFLTIGFRDKATTKNLNANVNFEKLSRTCSIVGHVSRTFN